MTIDERIQYESDIDTEMGKVLYVVEREHDDERDILAELVACMVRVRGRGPATLLTVGDLVADAIRDVTPPTTTH